MALKGSLRDFSLPDLFKLLNLSKKSGTLMLTLGEARGYVCFRNGEVFFATENWNQQPLGERMIEAGIVTWEQVHEALEKQTKEDSCVLLRDLLIQLGFITRSQLEIFVEEQIQEAVFELLRWDQADFEFMTQVLFPDEDIGLAIGTEELIMEGSRRLDEWSRIVEKIPSMEVVFKMAPLKTRASSSINLTADQWVALTFVDGRRSVRDIAEATAFSSMKSCKVLYELLTQGLLERVQSLYTPGSPPAPAPEPLTKEESRELAAATKISEMEELLKEAAKATSGPVFEVSEGEAQEEPAAAEIEAATAEPQEPGETEMAAGAVAGQSGAGSEEARETAPVTRKGETLAGAEALQPARARRPGPAPMSAKVLEELKALVLEGATDFDISVDVDSRLAEFDSLKAKIDQLIDLDDVETEVQESGEEIPELGITARTDENMLRSDQAAEARIAFRKMRYGDGSRDLPGSTEPVPAAEAADPLEAMAERIESGSTVEAPAVRPDVTAAEPLDYAPVDLTAAGPEIAENPAVPLELESAGEGKGHGKPESDFGPLERLEEIAVGPDAPGPEVADIDMLEKEFLEDIHDLEGVADTPVEEPWQAIPEMAEERAEAPADQDPSELQATKDGLAEMERKLPETYEQEDGLVVRSFPSWAESPELPAEARPDTVEEPVQAEQELSSVDPLDAREAVLSEEPPELGRLDETFIEEPEAADSPPPFMDDFFSLPVKPAAGAEPAPGDVTIFPSPDAEESRQATMDDYSYRSLDEEERAYEPQSEQETAFGYSPGEDAAQEQEGFEASYVSFAEPAEPESERAEFAPEPEVPEVYMAPSMTGEPATSGDAVLENDLDVVFHDESRGPDLAPPSQYFAPVAGREPPPPNTLSPAGTGEDTFEEFYSDSFGLERELAELTGAPAGIPSRKIKEAPAAAGEEPAKPDKAATPGKSKKTKPEKVSKGLLNKLIDGLKKR